MVVRYSFRTDGALRVLELTDAYRFSALVDFIDRAVHEDKSFTLRTAAGKYLSLDPATLDVLLIQEDR